MVTITARRKQLAQYRRAIQKARRKANQDMAPYALPAADYKARLRIANLAAGDPIRFLTRYRALADAMSEDPELLQQLRYAVEQIKALPTDAAMAFLKRMIEGAITGALIGDPRKPEN